MKYYKIIKDDQFIGVISSNNFVRNQKKYNFLENVDESLGQFANYCGTLYRDSWMQPLPLIEYNYLEGTVIEIPENVYNSFKAAIENNEAIDYNPPIYNPVITPEPIDTVSIEYAKQLRITELSNTCTQTIESGIDLENEHYSLTVTDQLNLLAAENEIRNGAEQVMYHTDGEDYRYFTAEEIAAIVSAANRWRIYNTTYFKAVKAYLTDLTDLQTILDFQYGDEVPDEYKSDILKELEQE